MLSLTRKLGLLLLLGLHIVLSRNLNLEARLRLSLQMAQTGCDHGHFHLIFQRLVDDRAEDDLGVFVRGFHDQGGGFIDLVDLHVRSARDVDDDAGCTVDRDVFEERARDCSRRCLDCAVITAAEADPHQGHAFARHNGPDISEVGVDHAGGVDQVRDTLNGVQQNFVGLLEGVHHGQRRARDRQQALVRDGDQRVNVFTKKRHAAFSVLHALFAFEHEGLGDHTYGEGADFFCDLREHRRCAGSGATAHAGSDEHHVRAAQNLGNLSVVFQGSFTADLGIGASAQSFGQLLADRYLHGSERGIQSLLVRVGRDEFHARQTHLNHGVYSVTA